MTKQKNKSRILLRYGIVTALMWLLGACIVLSLINITIFDADAWEKEARTKLDICSMELPERGSILASNGHILACNMMVWDIKLDMRHPKMLSSKINMAGLDSLADYLDEHYPRPNDLRSLPPDSAAECSWHARFRREMNKPINKRNRALTLAKGVEKTVFNELRYAPFFRDFIKTNNIPLYEENRAIRSQPYGMMARYSIGVINEVKKPERINAKGDTVWRNEIHGYSGLEKDLDSLLFGKIGIRKSVTLNNGVTNWTITPAVRGYDVVTTIDLQIQDILEQELYERCQAVNAEWGTALVMEVSTGEIKAISNIERADNGSYGEAYNRTVACFEPGSVIKLVSLLIAFEDGLITNNGNTVDCSPFMGTTDPHKPVTKTIPEVIQWSSNTGVARIIFRGYAQTPEKYYDRWESLGLLNRMHSGIAEERPPRIRRLLPQDAAGNPITMTARHLDLARQAYGYALEISPLYLLSVYNAIANDGVFVRPHLVRALRLPSGADSIITHAPIRPQLCTPEHARMLREGLRRVVTDGTACKAKLDEVVKIAGKTGTCIPVFPKGKGKGYDNSKRRYAFAGFFPYDNPRYSCMVLVEAPLGRGGAGSISGKVLSRVAERMYARGMLGGVPGFMEMRQPSVPVFMNAENSVLANLRRLTGNLQAKRLAGADPARTAAGRVPDVRNCDARTAVAQMEKRGLNVVLHGSGKVTSQSIAAGTPVKHGKTVILYLN